jgi:hypothetical protein
MSFSRLAETDPPLREHNNNEPEQGGKEKWRAEIEEEM